MKKKNIRDTPVIVIPKGYDVEDLLDTDDNGFQHEEPILVEEVIIRYERSNDKK